jgi:large repetitive protein
MRRLVRLLTLLVLASACLSATAPAASAIPVTSTASDGPGTLRTAIEIANSQAGPDAIEIEATGKIGLENKLPQIEGDLAITGPGPESLTVGRASGGGLFRIFEFASGVTGSLTGLTVTEGSASAGAGILNGSGSLALTRVAVVGNEAADEGGTTVSADGGGIRSTGPLTLRESVVSDNHVIASEGTMEVAAGGGGILSFGKLTIDRSTISDNIVEALGDAGETYALGGGIYAIGEVKIERSTISGNSVIAAGAGTTQATGGGIAGNKGELTSLTVTLNSAVATEVLGANLYLPDNPIVRNTLVSEPVGNAESCSGTFASGGYNLDEDGSCGFGQGSDLVGVAAGLDPALKDNGGPTPTHALLPGSIAIDRGNAFGGAIDQRGLPRPSDFPAIGNKEGGDGSDIGSFELQVPPPGPILVSAVPADRAAPNTRIVSGPPRAGFKRLAKFRFNSTESQSRFQCKVDRGKWRGCRSPFKRTVSAGRKHLFKVRAIDRFGNVDPTPARFGWRVKALS